MLSPDADHAARAADQPHAAPGGVAYDVVAHVSHELRTPLANVRGYAELLLDGELGPLSAEQTAALLTISRNVERLSRAVESVIEVVAFRAERA